MADLRIPCATYRLQINKKLNFNHAEALLPYLNELGVSHIYVSPLLQAQKDSSHGYDVTDPTVLNPELGGEKGFIALSDALREQQMGLLLDIVPNHMAASCQNRWWCDVLRHGPASSYSSYFDIKWDSGKPGLRGKIFLPVLAAPYSEVLAKQELGLALDGEGFWLTYNNSRFPLRPHSYKLILVPSLRRLKKTVDPGHPAAKLLSSVLAALSASECTDRAEKFRNLAANIWKLYNSFPEAKEALDAEMERLSAQAEGRTTGRLRRLLAAQHYHMAFWRAGNEEINYRRFFNITELVSVRVEEPEVFHATHDLIFRLARAGRVKGLRIDHIDGLADPRTYLERIREEVGSFYVVVEKILSDTEELPKDWPVDGTTGYDFLGLANGVFVYQAGIRILDRIYRRISGSEPDFGQVVYSRKRRVMESLFASEMRSLTAQLVRLAKNDLYGHELSPRQLKQVLADITARLPVYRTYIRDFAVSSRDRAYIEGAVSTARQNHPGSNPALDFLSRVLLLNFIGATSFRQRRNWLDFVRRWQQFTGPVMAKGVEDTALYVYNRLISLNEVGSDPGSIGVPVARFHHHNHSRREHWPYALNTTSTHDTKRGEDVRARINVLSEIPTLWARHLDKWRRWNLPHKPVVDGDPVPDGNIELLVYQTLIGAWPLRETEAPPFKERLQNYLIKSAREAKINTRWAKPNKEYEEALIKFVMSILEPNDKNPFLQDFLKFQAAVAPYGALNSLSQVLLKITAPGLPDIYQGNELWSFNLVDPDNRRPVDFESRVKMLAALQAEEKENLPRLLEKLLSSWQDGRVKLYLTYRALNFRRSHRCLFLDGEYLPVEAAGTRSGHILAFLRRRRDSWVLTAVPLFPARLADTAQPRTGKKEWPESLTKLNLKKELWGDTVLILPGEAPEQWDNVLTGEKICISAPSAAFPQERGAMSPAQMLANFPVGLLFGRR